jgi:hypothetical protein
VRRSRRFNVPTEWCVRKNSTSSGKTTVKRPEARAPGATELHRSALEAAPTFGIFEAFPDSAARDAHDIGPGGRNFLRSALLDKMLAYPSQIYRLDAMFGKFSTMFGKKITSA